MGVGLKLTVLGCSGSYPGPGQACSGYLVQGGGTTVWVDAGSGTLANLQRHVGLLDVDAIVLSHSHPDHWTDVQSYHVPLTYSDTPVKGLPVYAPNELGQLARIKTEPTFAWNDIADGDRVEIGALAFTFSETGHGPVTLAMRIDGDGRTLAYSADVSPDWSLEQLGTGLDAALCEATWLIADEGASKHFSTRQAGTSARRAGASRLLVTHLYPTNDRERARGEAADAYGGEVELVEENASYDI